MKASVTPGLTEADRSVACAMACDRYSIIVVDADAFLIMKALRGSKSSCRVYSSDCDFQHKFVHGSGAFVLQGYEKQVIRVSW